MTGTKIPRFAAGALLLCLLAVCATAPAYANASVFVNTGVASCPYGFCTAASTFGMLIGPSDAVSMAGNSAINILNDVGLKTGATLTTTGTVNVGAGANTSIVDFADTLAGGATSAPAGCTGSACLPPSGSSYSGTTTFYDGAASNPTLVNDAYTQFKGLANYWTAHTGISSLGAPTWSGTWNIGSTPGVHFYEYTSTTNITSQSSTLTFSCGVNPCDSSDLIIILVSSTASINLNKGISLGASGLTDDQVLYLINATGSGNGNSAELRIGSGSNNTGITVHGNFFLPNGNFTLGSTNTGSTLDFYGRIFADATAGAANTQTVNRGVTIEDEAAVPEPSTWAMMIAGVAGLIWFHRRRQKQQAAE